MSINSRLPNEKCTGSVKGRNVAHILYLRRRGTVQWSLYALSGYQITKQLWAYIALCSTEICLWSN